MSGPCTDCGGPDYQTLLAQIAELEAVNGELHAVAKNPSHIELQDLKWSLKQAEAERDALRNILSACDDLLAFLKPGDVVTVSTPGKRGSITFGMERLIEAYARWQPREGGEG